MTDPRHSETMPTSSETQARGGRSITSRHEVALVDADGTRYLSPRVKAIREHAANMTDEEKHAYAYLGVFARETLSGRVMLTVAQVSERLSVSERLVRRWIADGELPAFRAGRSIRIREADADAMLVPYSAARADRA